MESAALQAASGWHHTSEQCGARSVARNPGDDDAGVLSARTDDWLERVVEHQSERTEEILSAFAEIAVDGEDPGRLGALLGWLAHATERDFVAATGSFLEHLMETGHPGPERLDAHLRTVGAARREAQRLATTSCGDRGAQR